MQQAAGPWTGCDLGDITPLCAPWRETNHLLRPAFSREAAALSLELASSAYDMQTDRWRENGWFDFSYMIDNNLLTGSAVNGENADGGFSPLRAGMYQRAAQSLVKRQNPISLVRGALRQREGSDTCKCIVMAHRTGLGGFVIAIGFMGTGKRLYDWFSNFRTARDEGAHQGFLQLTKEFESNCARISFPQTARELGLNELTLSGIFNECRRPGSRFRIWMTGHSQGGAVMQLAAFRQIKNGLLRQQLIGYGFASPCVLYENPGYDLNGFPLFHLINGDDVAPRIGAFLHIGRCMVYRPDPSMRRLCYGTHMDSPAFRDCMALAAAVHGTREGLAFTVAFLQAVDALSDQDAAAIIGKMLGSLVPERMLMMLGSRTDQLLQYLMRHVLHAYAAVTNGETPPEGNLARFRGRFDILIRTYGAPGFIRAMVNALGAPHRLRGTDKASGGEAPYQSIVNRFFRSVGGRPASGNVPRAAVLPLRTGKMRPGDRFHTLTRRLRQRTLR